MNDRGDDGGLTARRVRRLGSSALNVLGVVLTVPTLAFWILNIVLPDFRRVFRYEEGDAGYWDFRFVWWAIKVYFTTWWLIGSLILAGVVSWLADAVDPGE